MDATESRKLMVPGKWFADFDDKGNATETYYDDTFRELLGYTVEEFADAQESWEEHVHPDDRERVDAYFADIMDKHPEGKDYDIEYRILTKWGYRWFHDHARISRRADGSAIHFEGVSFDIQHIKDFELQQAHDNLQKEILDYIVSHEDEDPIDLLGQFAEKIRTILDCDQVIYRDLEDTRIMVNSTGIEKQWSVPESYCRQCQHFNAFHPMYKDGYTEMDNCQEGWQGIPVYEKCPIKSSLTRIVYCNGEVAGYMAIHYVQKYHQFTDIERKTTEEFVKNFSLVLSRYEAKKEASKLQGLQRMLNTVFSLSDEFDPIIIIDPETGEYEWMMSRADEVARNTPMSTHGDNIYGLLGKITAEVIHEEDKEKFSEFYTEEKIKEVAVSGESREIENRWFISELNEYRWKYNKVVKMVDDRGKAHVVIGVIDTTEKKAQEKAQEAQKKQILENKQIISALTENNQRVMALEDNLESLYDVELESGQYIEYVKGDFYQQNVTEKLIREGDFFVDIRDNIEVVIFPEDRAGLNNVLDRENIRKALSETDRIEFFYRINVGAEPVWFKIRIVYKDAEKQSLIIGCFNAEEEMAEKRQAELAAMKNEELVNTFSKQYTAAYYGNLEDGTYRILTRKEVVLAIIGDTTHLCDALKVFAERTVYPADMGLFRDLYTLDGLKSKFKEDGLYTFEYRSNNYGEYRWFRAIFRKVNEREVLVGFRDCDDEVNERIVNEKLLNEYDALYLLNLETNELYSARPSRVSEVGNFEGKVPYDKVVMKFADTVAPAYRKDWVKFSNIAFLKHYLAETDHREHVYELPGTEKSMRRVTFDVLERDNGQARIVLMSFVGIDDLTAKAMLLQKNIAEQNIFTSYFLQPYKTAYYIDLNTQEAKIYKRAMEPEREGTYFQDFFKLTQDHLNVATAPEDRERLSNILHPDSIRKILTSAPSFRHTFRDISFEKDTFLQLEIVKGADDDHVALGFKDITEEVEEQNKRQMELQKALHDAKEANMRNDVLNRMTKSGRWSYEINEKDEIVGAKYADLPFHVCEQRKSEPMVWINYLHPDDKERVFSEFMAAIHDHTGKTPYISSFRILDETGKYRWNKSAGNLLPHEDGSAELFGMNIDITDQIEQQEEQQKQLEEALSMAQSASKAKTIFLNNMSHDIRTPMNAIIGYTGLAASHIDNKEQVQDYLAKIGQSSNHLLSLINDVLDMSRIESGKMNLDEKEEYLPDIIHTLRDIVHADIHSKQHDFFIDTVNVKDENIICDKLRLNQVLLNLLSNAIKYTAAGGTISMRIAEKTVKPSGYATYEFCVKDNGMGMSEEFLKTIFDPFSRVKSSTVSGIQGTGLGMAITKNIIDMMGGKIDVKSTLGKGTEITVTFDFKLTNAPKEDVEIPGLRGLKGLVADDDSNTCLSIAKMLKDVGMKAEWCTSGKEAVIRAEAAYHDGDLFKVYIIDWIMPDMNGIETARRIRRVIGDDAPIIILTAYDWSDIEEEAREAGVTDFVSKPMFPSDLHRVLSKCLGIEEASKGKEETSIDLTGKKILLVEDNVLNREIATAVLEEYGCCITPAEDGDIAVAKMKAAKAGDYDLVLMDIQMPTIDGYEATRQIRALGTEISKIPILAMTANAFEEDRKLALEAGMNEHIAKPIDLDQLRNVLAKFL